MSVLSRRFQQTGYMVSGFCSVDRFLITSILRYDSQKACYKINGHNTFHLARQHLVLASFSPQPSPCVRYFYLRLPLVVAKPLRCLLLLTTGRWTLPFSGGLLRRLRVLPCDRLLPRFIRTALAMFRRPLSCRPLPHLGFNTSVRK